MNQPLDTSPIGAESLVAARRVQRRRAVRIVSVFVLLPTLVVAIYVGLVQSRFYESVAVVAVEAAAPGGAAIDARADALLLRDFARSRDGLAYLVAHAGYREHFGSAGVDFRARLSRSAPNEDAYAHYERFVDVEIDPESGFVIVRARAHSGREARRLTTALVEAMALRAASLGGGDAAHPGRRLASVATPSLPDVASGPKVLRAILTALFGSIAILVIVSMVVSTALEHADV